MNPLSALFGAGVSLRNVLYDGGYLRQHALQHPVVSVGNLSVGGSGKTPFVLLLGRLLQQNQIAVDILSRGFGRRDTIIRLVDGNGDVSLYGDEPIMLARELQVPVIVGANRFAAGQYAETLFAETRPAHGRWFHLLDDGFQHRRLGRQFDIVLVSGTDLRDTLLPVGRLREPLSSLRRADAIVITDDTRTEALPEAVRNKEIWRVRRTVALPGSVPERVVAFCGVARPERFFADLSTLGVWAEKRTFPDHHHYSEADTSALLEMKARTQAEAFITTAKDLVNLGSAGLLHRLGKVLELKLLMEFVEPGPQEIFNILMREVGRV